MFNILANMIDLTGGVALDLYAGTGCVGFEAISRGAARVVFVESDRNTAELISRNAHELGVENACEIVRMKAEEFVKQCSEKFDVAYVDPPYKINNATCDIIDDIISRGMVRASGIICVEHSRAYTPPRSKLMRQKIFGSTILSFIAPEEK